MLYGTCGCHLCELAEALLLPLVADGWQVELVDIADDDGLMERYSLSIPVLRHEASQHELSWPFDRSSLAAFVAAIGETG